MWNGTRHELSSPVLMVAVRWLMRTTTPLMLRPSQSSKVTVSPRWKSRAGVAVIRPRAFFCVDPGDDICPEARGDGFSHWVRLDNLYDAHVTPLRLMAGSRSRAGHRTHHQEQANKEAGCDG